MGGRKIFPLHHMKNLFLKLGVFGGLLGDYMDEENEEFTAQGTLAKGKSPIKYESKMPLTKEGMWGQLLIHRGNVVTDWLGSQINSEWIGQYPNPIFQDGLVNSNFLMKPPAAGIFSDEKSMEWWISGVFPTNDTSGKRKAKAWLKNESYLNIAQMVGIFFGEVSMQVRPMEIEVEEGHQHIELPWEARLFGGPQKPDFYKKVPRVITLMAKKLIYLKLYLLSPPQNHGALSSFLSPAKTQTNTDLL